MMAQRAGAHRRAVHLPGAVDRRALGQADLGHLVGLGCAADLELILLFLYIGFMALQAAIDDPRRADRAGAVLALVGVVNVPIIYFSVQVVEHAAPGRVGEPDAAPSMAATMLTGMLLMALAFWMYAIAVR